MDLNYCTTMVNRSNYCSILKKRKSSYKENVTVKLKRHSLKDENGIQMKNDTSDEDNHETPNDYMCLICRTRSECSTDTSCSSMATLRRLQQQQQQQQQENDIQNSQSCTNCVVKASSIIPSVPSPSPATKWNALENANQKSQSQWNATAVSFSWCNSSSSSSPPNGRSSSSSSSMPSCQLQSTSSSSSIPPTVSKTSSLSSSITTKTLSSPPLFPACSSSSLLLSSSLAAAATATTVTDTTTELSSSAASVDSSQLSSSRTNATSPPCSVSTCVTSTSTTSSTSFSGSDSDSGSKNCANVFRNARVTNVSVLRTFAFVTVILEKCLTGMFGTRQRMPLEHEIDNRVTRRQSKRSNNISLSLPMYPLMFMFLVFSFMTIVKMLPTTEGADVRLQRNETVCKSRDIRNSPSEFHNLTNCTVIEGFLLITLIAPNNTAEYDEYSFPLLTEVTEFVMIYHVNGLRTLSTLFPNLSVIRGKELFEGFALVIYENTHLEEVGLPSLTTIAKGAVRIEKNPALCFVETIDWTQIAVNMTSDQHFFRENKAKRECPLCPGESDKQNDGTDVSVSCPLVQGQRHCWNSRTCQKICPSTCKNNCNDDLQCCDEACIGGCAKKNLSSCTSCRHFAKMDVCMEKCPENFFSYLERRCVTADTCRNVIGTKLEGTKQEYLVPYEGVCSVRCPPGHNKIKAECKKCEGKGCQKQCEGGIIDSVGAAKLMHGCTRIVKTPLTISIKRGGRHLMEELEMGLSSIEEIDTYLKVHRTYGMVSLAFFKSLKRIKGITLESDKFALYVLENQDLESIWGQNQTVKIDEGRVFFHFNPKLCYSVIDALRPSLKNASQFDKNEVATDSNGSKGSCNTETLYVKVQKISSVTALVNITNPMKFEDDRAFIGYQYFHTEDPYRNVSIFGQRPCDDSWSSDDPSKESTHIFTNLKPFTQYAFYVKTHTISSEPRNGQSEILYFRTKPDQPKNVQNLKAVSNSSAEVIVHWLRPTITNGNLTHYIIRARIDPHDQAKLKSRNYCNDPLKEAVTSDIGVVTISDKSSSIGGGPDCKCEKNVTRKDGSNPQLEEAIYENIIDFENNIQNFVYVKQTNDSLDGNRRRRRRAVDYFNSHQEKVTPLPTTTPPPTSEDISRMDNSGSYYETKINIVNASITEFVLTKLKHFSLYTISVQACRAPEEDENNKNCSGESTTFARTQKLADVDVIRNLQVELEQSNTTGANLRVKWDPPESPNGLVVSYTIFYIASNSPDAVFEKRCITELDYQQHFTNGYLIAGLPTANYSIQVRANSLAGEGIKSEPYYKYIPPKGVSWQTYTYIGVGLLVFIGIVIWVGCYIRKKFLAPPSDLKIFPTVNPYYISMQYLPDEWEVPRDKILQLGALGQGSFGMVYEGILKHFNNQENTPCAIKTVNENATDRERLNFLKEASVMKQFNTHHVVRLLGVCSRGQPALVIMELMKNGDLKAYLRQHRPEAEPIALGEPPMRPPTLGRILQIAIEIADGMAYLAAKKYVHRDLAARNCMVAADLTVKIGDFGMTRDIYETDYYRKGTKGLLPVRWMSPESLKDGVFSSASDVFSYGVVLWEMATLASQPYQGFSNDQVLRFVIDGGVMERPENCPDKLYKLMQKCWEHRPSARPTFMEIIRFLLDTADPKFQEVSFYHSTEAKDMVEQMHPEHDMDDVTTPLRVGEFDYKLNIDDNSSVEPHESPALDEEDDDEEDDNMQPHSPYSLGSAIIISSTPGGHSKHSPNIIINQSNPSLSLPSTSAAAIAASIAAASAIENAEYVQPDPSFVYNEQPRNNNDGNISNTANNPPTPAQKANKNHTSSLSSATSKYPNSLKRAVASTVQNVSNSLVPLRIPNMNFLHRRLFKNSSNLSSSGGRKGRRNSGTTKSETTGNNGNNNNSSISAQTPNAEIGSTTGSRSFFSGLTPSHTSKNPNYQILDETLNVSAMQDEQYPLEERLSPSKSQEKQIMLRSRTGSNSSGGSRNSSNRNNGSKPIQQPHETTDQCNLNRDNSNLSTSSNIKDTKSSQSQKQNQPINQPSSAHELTLSSGVSSPISIKDNRNTSDASTVISTFTAPATKTPHQLKENWLRQLPQLPPNGFIGREG